MPRERTAIVLSEEILKQYTGVYEISPEFIIHVKLENGKLMGEREGQGSIQLHPEKMDFFFLKEIDAQIKFTRDKKNEVVSMTFYQKGEEKPGKKR